MRIITSKLPDDAAKALDVARKVFEGQIPYVQIPPRHAGDQQPCPEIPKDLPPHAEVWALEPDQLANDQPPVRRSWCFIEVRDGRPIVGEVRGDPPQVTRVSYGLAIDRAVLAVQKVIADMEADHREYELRILTSTRLVTEAFWLCVDATGMNDVVVPYNTVLRELNEGERMTLAGFRAQLKLGAKRLPAKPLMPEAQ
jgi:hypothetical protein